MKNEEKDFNDDDAQFQSFLELLKEGMRNSDGEEIPEEELFPNLEENLGLSLPGDGEEECPMLSHLSDIINDAVDNIGFLGLRWEDEEMINILSHLGYEKSTYTLQINFSDELEFSEEEKAVVDFMIPDGNLDVDIVKKSNEEITEENFRNHRPKEVFNKEMKGIVSKFIMGLISEDTINDNNNRKE